MKKLLRIVVLLVIVAVIVTVVRRKLVKNPTAEGPLTLYGNVDIREVDLGFRVAGRIATMDFEEGDAVSAGQRLATLDEGPLNDSLELAKAQAAIADAAVKKLEAGTRLGEIAIAKALLEERETAIRNFKKILKRLEKPAESGAVSKQRLEDARTEVDAAEARLKSAQEALALAEEGPRVEDIAIARAEREAAHARVAQAQRQFDDAQLLAPSDGIILTRIREPGAIVAIGVPVYLLSLESPVWVRCYIAEPDLGSIHPGMSVDVMTDSRPNQPYEGQIGFISPVAEFTPKSVETEELRTDLVYRLRVIIKEPDEALRQGMPVTLRLPDAKAPR